jgi:GxxExxY protein
MKMGEDDCYVDEGTNPELNAITNGIIGAAIEVHRQLGAGLMESLYENALAIEFRLRGISFTRQVPIAVAYKGEPIGETRLDVVVAGRVVVELKAVESLAAVHRAQMICYLKITKHKLGILINFNVPVLKDGIRRIAN